MRGCWLSRKLAASVDDVVVWVSSAEQLQCYSEVARVQPAMEFPKPKETAVVCCSRPRQIAYRYLDAGSKLRWPMAEGIGRIPATRSHATPCKAPPPPKIGLIVGHVLDLASTREEVCWRFLSPLLTWVSHLYFPHLFRSVHFRPLSPLEDEFAVVGGDFGLIDRRCIPT